MNLYFNQFTEPPWNSTETTRLFSLDRTFPTHKMFMEGTSLGKEGRAALFRILAVYILYNPQVSYCQGTVTNLKIF